MTSVPTVTLTTSAPIPPVATLMATTAAPNIVGFRRAVKTPLDDTISRYMDATQVLMCQLMDEVVRDLLGEVSHYNIPESATCDEFYSWLENVASKTLDKNLSMFSSVLSSIGLGDVPDNMKDQTDVLRDSIVGVLRAAFDPVCTGGSALSKVAVMKRMKELQGFLCAMKSDTDAGGPWPKFETDPLTGSQTIVSKDGTRVKINLDNSADNTNNLSNMVQDNGSGKLDPNILAALLLANNRPQPPVVVAPVDPGTTGAPEEDAPSADVDTGLILGNIGATPAPTAAPVSTIFGLGPVGSVIVFGLIVLIVTLVWVLRKSPGGASVPPRDVPAGFAAAVSPTSNYW